MIMQRGNIGLRGYQILKAKLQVTIIVEHRRELLKKFIKGSDLILTELFREALHSMLLAHLLFMAIATLYSHRLLPLKCLSNTNILYKIYS